MIKIVAKLLRRESHMSWALLDQAMVSGANFLTGILLARYLGIREFGVFTLAWMTVLFANNLQVSLIISPMMSIGPKQTTKEGPAYFGAVFTQQLIFSGFVSLLTLFGLKISTLFLLNWQLESLVLPLTTSIFFFMLQDFLRRYFFTVGRAYLAFVNDAVSYIGQLVILVGLVMIMKLDSAVVLWVITATSVAAIVMGMFGLGKLSFDSSKLWPIAVRHWSFSSWITGSSLIQWAGSQGVLAMAAAFLGATSLGGIRAVFNLVAPINVLMLAMQNSLPIGASKALQKHGHAGLIKYLLRISIMVVLVVSGISFVATIFSRELLLFLYGPRYVSFSNLVVFQSIYAIAGAFIAPLVFYFRTIEQTRLLSISTFLAACFSILFSMMFIKQMKELAVYIGLIANQVVNLVILLYAFSSNCKCTNKQYAHRSTS
jgi:O-antigen/teichoic acid export membrane protein